MDGTDIWTKAHWSPYSDGEGATRVINDDTLMPELLELRQRYLDRSVEAGDEQEAQVVRNNYLYDALTLVTGQDRKGLRSLGPTFDQRMLEARRKYMDRLARSRGLSDGGAFKRFAEDLIAIILDALTDVDKAREAKDKPAPALQASQAKAPAVDGGKGQPEALPTPAPALQPAPVVADAARRVVEVLDRREEPDVANLTQELERALAKPPQPDPVTVGKLETIAATSPYAEYDKRVTEAHKRPPPTPKRKKGAQHDLV